MLILGCHVDAGAGSQLLSSWFRRSLPEQAGWLEVFEGRCSSKKVAALRRSLLEQPSWLEVFEARCSSRQAGSKYTGRLARSITQSLTLKINHYCSNEQNENDGGVVIMVVPPAAFFGPPSVSHHQQQQQ